jgi:hypothetical protein
VIGTTVAYYVVGCINFDGKVKAQFMTNMHSMNLVSHFLPCENREDFHGGTAR